MRKSDTYFWFVGEKEVDEDGDFWADHNENVHGRYEDHEDDPDYAGGFRWNCCDGLGEEDGCVQSKHEPTTTVKKARN